MIRNPRQAPLGSEGSDAPPLQQLMETMRALRMPMSRTGRTRNGFSKKLKSSKRVYKKKPELSKCLCRIR